MHFPQHRGFVMAKLFNWVFKGVAQFGRIDEVVFASATVVWSAIEWFEELFFAGSRIAGEIGTAIADVIMQEERCYFCEDDIPF